ncbi:MAG: hypothetical protein AB7O04_16290 [Hyphomonadaceae bacterium]
MSLLALSLLGLAIILAALAFAFPAHTRLLSSPERAQLIYLLMVGLLIGAGAFGIRSGVRPRLKQALFYLLLWAGVFAAIVWAVQFYNALVTGGRISV